MSNKLIEEIVLGGFSYEVAFPFSKAREVSLKKVLTRLGKVLNEKALNAASKILKERGYDYCLQAIEVVERRFLFYKHILEFEELKGKYLEVLDSKDLVLRIVFAMNGCIEQANKILLHIKELEEEVVSDSVSAVNIGYSLWAISNLNNEPTTKCLMTGVCICEQGDIVPFVKGCVISDPTRIMISKEEHEKRLAHDREICVARRLEKNNK